MDGRQHLTEMHGQIIRASDEQASDRGKGLGESQHRLTLLRSGKQLGQPRHRGHEFHADADARGTAQEQQHPHGGGEPGGKCGKRIEQNTQHEYATPSPQVGEISAHQAKHATDQKRHEEQQRLPQFEFGHPRLGTNEVLQDGPHDERHHQQFIDVEREADRRNDTHRPLDKCQVPVSPTVGGCVHVQLLS